MNYQTINGNHNIRYKKRYYLPLTLDINFS